MNESQIKQIFKKAGLGEIHTIQKIEVGFSNSVYSIDDRYILKVKAPEENDDAMAKDIYLCHLFTGKLPVPKIIHEGDHFFIYKKIQGENLYNVWHKYSNEQRLRIIQQICEFLKIMNQTDPSEFAGKFGIDLKESWKNKVQRDLGAALHKVKLSEKIADRVRSYIDQNLAVLNQEKMALTYWDLHFDNFLVLEGKIVGMLDFERSIYASIDYVLVLVRRMMNNPKKYASEHAEQFVEKADYENLMEWYKEFYPELFNFEYLEKRLDLYLLEQLLIDLYWYPEAEALKSELENLLR